MSDDTLNLVQGTLDLLILQTLAAGATHGYGISHSIRQRTGGTIAVQDAALYQALRRLEARNLVDAEWGLSENNRRARYYRLTVRGRKQLKADTEAWKRYSAAVFQVLAPATKGAQ